MQIVRSQSQIVERIIRDKEGRLARATFCVYEIGGRIKARLLNVVYLAEKALKTSISKLSGNLSKKSLRKISFKTKIVSPFITLDSLYFNGTKARAPTL